MGVYHRILSVLTREIVQPTTRTLLEDKLPALLLGTVLSLTIWFSPYCAYAVNISDNAIVIEKLLETEKSWDDTHYHAYLKGTPELSVLKITIPPNTLLDWHEYPIPSAAYVQHGALMVMKKADGLKRRIKQGEVLAEMVDCVHRAVTDFEGATLIVFYAGQKGTSLSAVR